MLDFLGVGSQKSGTTWLYNALNRHPLINFPQGKEIHFWNNETGNENIKKYLDFFSSTLFVEGEITPAYGHLERDRIEVIHENLPNIKIIYMMRDPVDRAWSSALMALKRSEMVFSEASDQWFIDHFVSSGSLLRGNYELALMNWASVYPENQILPLFFEDMVVAPEQFITSVFEYLEVDVPDNDLITSWGLGEKVFSGSGEKIRPQLKIFLKSFYKEKVISLERYLELDLSVKWGGWWNE